MLTEALVLAFFVIGIQLMVPIAMAALAAVVAAAALTPFLLPYLQARREQEMFVRTLDEVGKFSAS